MGMGAGGLRKFFRRRRRRRRRRPPPQSRVFGENGILRFVTHSRAMNFLASAYESYGRGASFIFFMNSWASNKIWGSRLGGKKKRPCGNVAASTQLLKVIKYCKRKQKLCTLVAFFGETKHAGIPM